MLLSRISLHLLDWLCWPLVLSRGVTQRAGPALPSDRRAVVIPGSDLSKFASECLASIARLVPPVMTHRNKRDNTRGRRMERCRERALRLVQANDRSRPASEAVAYRNGERGIAGNSEPRVISCDRYWMIS
jgi:hypothetical protein